MKKFLVIAHVYYHDLWYLLDRCIQNLPKDSFDLIVTTTSNIEELSSKVKEHAPNAKVVLCENRGYDIWPFIKVLKTVNLDEYEFVIKIHTKRDMGKIVAIIDNKYFFRGQYWRNMLLSFISSKENFDKCLEAFKDPSVGMINNHRLFDRTRETTDNPHLVYCFNEARKLLSEVGITAKPYDEVEYVAGTMFICRAAIFKTLQTMNFDVNRFAAVNRKNENDLAHVMERVFGWLVTSQGYSITDPYSTFKESFRFFFHCSYSRLLTFKLIHHWFSKFVRFFSRIEDKSDNCYLILFKCLKIRLPKPNNK